MLIEELKEIVRKEQDVIPFLKKLSLNAKEKRAFVEEIKQLRAVVFERKEIRKKVKWGISYTTEQTHTDTQETIMNLACFVLYNKTDARKAFSGFLIDDDLIQQVLPWYVPKWYGDLVNEVSPWRLDYQKLIYLYENNYLEPSKTLVVAKLPGVLVESHWENAKNKMFYRPETLLANKVTLETHLWYLFEEESAINHHNYLLNFENYKKVDDVWIHTIANLVEEQKIDRTKTLIATIYTSTKGFNKNLSGWFFDLLINLNPTKEEVLSLQDEFYAALNSPHSKVVNTVLKYFKIAAIDKKFKHTVFIENTSILLSSEVKSVVNSTLMILDKIAKTQKSLQIDICKKASEALLNSDEKIQVRAAKIIAKYGDVKDEELCDEITIYADNLFYASKEIINEYVQTESLDIIEEEETVEVKVLSSDVKLPVYKGFDDIFFFVNQVLDNNENYHIDLLFVYLPKLNLLLNEKNVSRLTPMFKRAFDFSVSDDWSSQKGYIEFMVAFYINDFGKILLEKYPAELVDFWKYRDKKLKEISNIKRYRAAFGSQSIQDYAYNVPRFLFLQSKAYLKNKEVVEFLSTPTHAPCWIAPEVFLDRMLAMQRQRVAYEYYDFQIALGRIPLTEITTEISAKIDQINSKEIRGMLRYFFGQVTLQESTIFRPKIWLQSILTRKSPADIAYFEETTSFSLKRETASYTWTSKPVEHTYKEYNYQEQKHEQKTSIAKQLEFDDFIPAFFKEMSFLEKIRNIFISKKRKKVFDNESIYKLINFRKERYHTTIQPKDDIKFLFLAPNNPGPYLAQIIHLNLLNATFYSESSKKNMINVLKGLYEIWYRPDYSETTYLFLAAGFLCSEKVAREIAAEIWIKTSSEATMNHILLGKTIGKIQFGEYAPMKRLTDIITLNMFNVSKKHNRYLFELTDAIIQEMNDTPMRGLKKVLELFLELKRNLSDTIISEATKEKLQTWKTNKTLKPVIEKLV